MRAIPPASGPAGPKRRHNAFWMIPVRISAGSSTGLNLIELAFRAMRTTPPDSSVGRLESLMPSGFGGEPRNRLAARLFDNAHDLGSAGESAIQPTHEVLEVVRRDDRNLAGEGVCLGDHPVV